jgi:hypothetical protein
VTDQPAPFQQLDFLYTPSLDVAADLTYFSEVLGGRVVFAVEAILDALDTVCGLEAAHAA